MMLTGLIRRLVPSTNILPGIVTEGESATRDALSFSFANVSPATGPSPDLEIARRILEGDEAQFVVLVERHHRKLLRLARIYIPSAAVAEEVVLLEKMQP